MKRQKKAFRKREQGRIVKFGVIGVGGMGAGHCNVLKSVARAKLTAVCDADRTRAEEIGKQCGVPCFYNHRDLIKSGLCDAVIVATPHPEHPRVAIDCMNAGIHVLSEKPLSERVSTADKMVRVAKKNKVAFVVMFQRRHEPVMAKAISLMKRGEIGKIYRTVMISPEYRSQAYYDSGKWRATWSGEGGGVMMNQSPHILDLFIQLCGMPSEVYGRIETRLHDIEVEDQAEAMLKYPDGGTGYLYCSTNEAGPGQMIEIFGDKGKLVLRNGQISLYRFKPAITKHIATCKEMWSRPEIEEVPLKITGKQMAHRAVIDNMVRHILCGENLVTPGYSGVDSLELANAITMSSFENKWVKLPISRSRYDKLLAHLRKTSKFAKKTGREQRVTDPGHK